MEWWLSGLRQSFAKAPETKNSRRFKSFSFRIEILWRINLTGVKPSLEN